ncbi:MAG: prepilin-type N-terminal cleavage/methylation domain-containing protein [Pseudomonadales bacterium]
MQLEGIVVIRQLGRRRSEGFTLVELMIVVAVLAVISAIAIPLYSGYIQTSREGVLVNNISTIEIFQEDFRLRNGNYFAPAADAAAIEARIGWTPRDDGNIDYSIAAAGNSYRVTATDATGVTVCMQMPEKIRCP